MGGALVERQLPGVTFRPQWFQPVYHKHKEVPCGGLQVHVTDREVFRPAATAMHMIETARDLWPNEFGWRPPSREGTIPAIDRLYGSGALRALIDGGAGAEEVIKTWDPTPFESLRGRALLY